MKKKNKITTAKLKGILEPIFNHFIRLRDKGKPCISCGKVKTLQAGHYYSVKMADAFRFDERNVHGECAGCNCLNQDHLILYTKNIEIKLGKEELEDLHYEVSKYKRNRNSLKYKWYRHELEEKIIYYKAKVLEYL